MRLLAALFLLTTLATPLSAQQRAQVNLKQTLAEWNTWLAGSWQADMAFYYDSQEMRQAYTLDATLTETWTVGQYLLEARREYVIPHSQGWEYSNSNAKIYEIWDFDTYGKLDTHELSASRSAFSISLSAQQERDYYISIYVSEHRKHYFALHDEDSGFLLEYHYLPQEDAIEVTLTSPTSELFFGLHYAKSMGLATDTEPTDNDPFLDEAAASGFESIPRLPKNDDGHYVVRYTLTRVKP